MILSRKRKIDPLHTVRDYDEEKSSKNDVVPDYENVPLVVNEKRISRKNTIKNAEPEIKMRPPPINIEMTIPSGELLSMDFDRDNEEILHKAVFFYHGKTFIYCKRSIIIFTQEYKLRKFAVWLTESIYFEMVTNTVIILNAIVLGFLDFSTVENQKDSLELVGRYQIYFAIYYFVEAFLVILSKGFSGSSSSYMKDPMNWIDFFIAITGLLYDATENFRFLSVIRLYKVIKSIKRFKIFKGINEMVEVMSQSIVSMISVIGLLFFMVCLFGIFVLNIYSGELDYRCRTTPVPLASGVWPTSDVMRICGGEYNCPLNQTCGSNYDYPSIIINDLNRDTYYKEFNFGFTSFDNALISGFTVMIIGDGNWEILWNNLSDSSSQIGATIFFSFIYIIYNFFIIRLGVAIIFDNYMKIKEKENKRKYAITAEMLKSEEVDDTLKKMASESRILDNWKSRFEAFVQKYFPEVEVPSTRYYKNIFTPAVFRFIHSGLFRYLSLSLIIFNIVIVAIDNKDVDKSTANLIIKSNKALSILHFTEVLLKLIAFGSYKFFRKKFNIFEFSIAVISLFFLNASNVPTISTLRLIRAMRYFREEYGWDNFQVLLTVFYESLIYLMKFAIILTAYVYTYSILGMKFFGGKFHYEIEPYKSYSYGTSVHMNFDTLHSSCSLVLQILLGENLTEALIPSIRFTGWASIIYYISLLITGKYLLIQLFLGFVLGTFEISREKINFGHLASKAFISRMSKNSSKKRRPIKKSSIIIKSKSSINNLNVPSSRKVFPQTEIKLESKSQEKIGSMPHHAESMADLDRIKNKEEPKKEIQSPLHSHELKDQEISNATQKNLYKRLQSIREYSKLKIELKHQATIKKQETLHRQASGNRSSRISPEEKADMQSLVRISFMHRSRGFIWITQKIYEMKTRSFGIFSKDGLFRIYVKELVESKFFNIFVLLFILLSSFFLIFDSPAYKANDILAEAYYYVDILFTLVFTIEMIMKMIAHGVFYNWYENRNAYFRNYWNVLDFLVVVESIADLFYSGGSFESLSVLRLLRAFRPLRFISRNEGLKVIINSLLRTLPFLRNLFIVAGTLIVIGAINGVQAFQGKFYYCAGTNSTTILTKDDCISSGNGEWVDQNDNFDTFFNSLLIIFEIFSGKGWITSFYSAVDYAGMDMQPQIWANVSSMLPYFVLLIFFALFFKFLFVGVVIDNYQQMKEELNGFLMLTYIQRDWVEMQLSMQKKKLKMLIPTPENRFREFCFNLAKTTEFEAFILLIIVLNTVVLGLKYPEQSSDFEYLLEVLNNICLAIFHLEAFIKISGWGLFYFRENWNRFDFAIVVVTDIVFIVSAISPTINLTTAPIVARSLRLGRIFKIIRASRHIKVIMDTIYYLIPSIVNYLSIFLLIIFIYTAVGMNLFARIMQQTHINNVSNFRDFWSSLSIVLKCSLGQRWTYYMFELSDADIPGCIVNQSNESLLLIGSKSCGSWQAYPYFITLILIVNMIFINLFLAIVIGGYIDSRKENEAIINSKQIEELLDKWAEYDPHGTGILSAENYVFLIHDLPPPLGLKDENSVKYEFDIVSKKNKGYLISENKKIVLRKTQLLRDLKYFNIPVYLTKVHFSDVCRILSRNAVVREHKISMDDFEIKADYVNKELDRGWTTKYPILKKLQKEARAANVDEVPQLLTSDYFAGRSIYNFYVKFREEKRLNKVRMMTKLGSDYEKGFNFQQRVTNMQFKKGPSQKNLKVAKISRTRTKLTQTQPSIQSKPSFHEAFTLRKMVGQKDQTPRKQIVGSSTSIDVRKQDIHLERIDRYKNLNTRTNISKDVSEKVPSHYDVEDFWVETEIGRKFPVPVTFEIEKSNITTLDSTKNDRTNDSRADSHSSLVKLIKERERQILSEWKLPESTAKRIDSVKKSINIQKPRFEEKFSKNLKELEPTFNLSEEDKLVSPGSQETASKREIDSPDRMTRISLGNINENSDLDIEN